MKLIVGLGNPGSEYLWTRHNLGFHFIDYLAEKLETELNKKKFNSLYSAIDYESQKIFLLKPLNFMNNSGECLRNFIDYFKIPLKEVLIVYDDLALPVGNYRYRLEGSGGGHNGMKNVIYCLKTQKIKRLRVGIGSNSQILWKEWVLKKFTGEEKLKLINLFPFLTEGVLEWIKNNDFIKAMNLYNQNILPKKN